MRIVKTCGPESRTGLFCGACAMAVTLAMLVAAVGAVAGLGLRAGASSTSFVSDDVAGAGLDVGLWAVVDPLGDRSVSTDGSRLVLSVPEGPSHNVSVAQRLGCQQRVAGDAAGGSTQ